MLLLLAVTITLMMQCLWLRPLLQRIAVRVWGNHTVVFDCIHRLEYFGVQFYGECWSGPDAGETFARDGNSEDCYEGVGKRKTNAVYRIEDLPGKQDLLENISLQKVKCIPGASDWIHFNRCSPNVCFLISDFLRRFYSRNFVRSSRVHENVKVDLKCSHCVKAKISLII